MPSEALSYNEVSQNCSALSNFIVSEKCPNRLIAVDTQGIVAMWDP